MISRARSACTRREGPSRGGELHDGLDDVVVVGAERRDGLLPRALHLGHDKLDVLRLNAGLICLVLVIRLLDLGLYRCCLLRARLWGASELLRGRGLGLGAEIL